MNEISKCIEVKIVLRQGDTLSTGILKLSLEQVVRYMKDNRSMKLIGNRGLLAHADDTVILGESQD